MNIQSPVFMMIAATCLVAVACSGTGQSAPPSNSGTPPSNDAWALGKDSPGYASVIGNNYVNFQTAAGHPLYSTLRSPNAPVKTTVSLDVTATASRPDGATKRLGAFSGEDRYYDFGSTTTANSWLGRATGTLQTSSSQGFITIVPGGGVNGGSPENWALIRANNAKYFKDFVYATVMAVNSGPYFAQHPIMAFEIGNEVNAVGQFNVLGVKNEKDPNYSAAKQAQGYVDDFLAPGIEAVRKASTDLYGDPRKLLVISAGIGGIYSPAALEFIDTFMNLTPSPSTTTLTGPIKNNIDILGIHYSMRFPFNPNKANNGYETTFRHLKERWVDTNVVKGIWGTEEAGDHGRGAYDALLSSFRFIHWWSTHGWEKLSLGGKLIWFGENNWYNFKDVQGMLLDLWSGGTARQVDITEHLALSGAGLSGAGLSGAQLEGYALSNTSLTDPKIALVVSSNAPAIAGSGRFSQIVLKNVPEGIDLASLRITGYRVTATVLDESVSPPNPVGKPMVLEPMTLSVGPDRSLQIQLSDTILSADELLFMTISR